MIRLENVIKIYGEDYEKKIALNNICLEIKDGEFVAVTGPSGSGKSTLLNIIVIESRFEPVILYLRHQSCSERN